MILQWLLVAAAVLINVAALPYFLYILVISLAAIWPRRAKSEASSPTSRFLVVIPAHDEEPVVSTAVRSCLAAGYPRSQFGVVVIADNCSDQTAAVAAAAGARVVERFDEQRRSKGYAIEYLIENLERSGEFDAIDAIVLVDADTTIDRDLLVCFDRALREGHDWSQVYYTVANPDESWRTRLLKYAFSLFNGVVPLGQTRLGVSTTLKGNGMCFSVPGLRRVPWRCYGLVEDMEYAWTLRTAGERIAFLPDVSVYGAMLRGGGPSAVSQRQRWEVGRSDIRKKYLGPLMRSGRIGWWEKLLSIGELAIPPMAVIAAIYTAAMALNLGAALGVGTASNGAIRYILLATLGVYTFALAAYAMSPFLAMRLPWKYALSLPFFPFYVLWKVWISFRARPDRWIRTERALPREDDHLRKDRVTLSG
jgi:cellulose synthase/poly-beta-1,6-N-acetylglucosamine synthase-like glycosyltransferase